MHSKYTLENDSKQQYYTIANNAATKKKSWYDEHIFYMYGEPYQVSKMWSVTADTPISHVPMSSLRPALYNPVWTSDDTLGGYFVTPMQVIDNIEMFPAHKDRILKANMAYCPIILNGVYEDRIIKNAVADGHHRLAYAELNKMATIGVKRITEEQWKRCKLR